MAKILIPCHMSYKELDKTFWLFLQSKKPWLHHHRARTHHRGKPVLHGDGAQWIPSIHWLAWLLQEVTKHQVCYTQQGKCQCSCSHHQRIPVQTARDLQRLQSARYLQCLWVWPLLSASVQVSCTSPKTLTKVGRDKSWRTTSPSYLAALQWERSWSWPSVATPNLCIPSGVLKASTQSATTKQQGMDNLHWLWGLPQLAQQDDLSRPQDPVVSQQCSRPWAPLLLQHQAWVPATKHHQQAPATRWWNHCPGDSPLREENAAQYLLQHSTEYTSLWSSQENWHLHCHWVTVPCLVWSLWSQHPALLQQNGLQSTAHWSTLW